ncbi:MAG TPA: Ig-like domain-containing protein, partial [Longimicrobiales bacterium]
ARRLVATVTDADGNTVDARVVWESADSGVAQVSQDGDVTGVSPGSTMIMASALDQTASVRVKVTGTPTGLEYVDGNAQIGLAGSPLPTPLAVRVVDRKGSPVSGVPIRFVVTQGGGTVSPALTNTDSRGSATAVWTLGAEGPQRLEAIASAAGSRTLRDSLLVFTATAITPNPTQVPVATVTVTPRMDTTVVGTSVRYVATLRDAAGNTLTGRTVSWTSSNTAVARAASDGTVSGMAPGGSTIHAVAEGVVGSAQVYVVAAPRGTLQITAPRDTLYDVGDTLQVRAVARSADGTLIEGTMITWTSLTPSIATVDALGRVIARSAGVAMIAASAVCCSGDTAAFVVDPPAGSPPAVADLAVVSATSNSVTLRWTAVTDGDGGAATYAIRYGTPTLNWGTAYSTERVISAVPVGQVVTYTYSGLTAGTNYQFRLVSYRGTLNEDAVFGPASNLLAVSTLPGDTPPPPADTVVTRVTATPATHTFTALGQTQQITAVAQNASGQTITTPLRYTSSNTSVVGVDNMGRMTANAAGTAMIIVTALCCGPSDTVQANVDPTTPPPPPPGGGTAFFSDGFEAYTVGSTIDGQGGNGFSWTGVHDGVYVSSNFARTGSRSLMFEYAPVDPNNPSNTHYWAEQNFNLGRNVTELWMEYYMYFPTGFLMPSGTAQNNKFLSLWADSYQSEPLAIYQLWTVGDRNIARIDVGRTEGNADGDADLIRYPRTNNGGSFLSSAADRGRWIRVRFHVRLADLGQSNGVLQMWKDDQLMINIQNDPFFDEARANNYLRNGYLMGYDNARFDTLVRIYLDDFRVFNQSPGW